MASRCVYCGKFRNNLHFSACIKCINKYTDKVRDIILKKIKKEE